jgi:hypothetical protein
MLATFVIDNKIAVFWLNLLLEYLSENTSGWLQLIKKDQFIILSVYCM